MITVNCSDGKISIGGDFNAAKSFIKNCGAHFNGATKEWSIGESIKKFDPLNGFPFPVDVLSGSNGRMSSGDHVTRYGNSYTRNEWNAKIESEKVSLSHKFQPRFDTLKGELISKLQPLTPDDKIARIIDSFDGIDEMVSRGALIFSSPEKERAIREIENWYDSAKSALYQEQDDAETAIKEQIYDKYGL